jgi:hypothetical protein
MRLIDADALWERLDYEPWEHNADRDEIALPFVNAAPTIDAEVVVRCKDCKHSWEDIGGLCCSHRVCINLNVPDDFYCAYGERKDGGADGAVD